jgi:hypothetical protein
VLGPVAAALAPLLASRGVRTVRLPVLGAEEADTEGFRALPPRRLRFYREVSAEAARARSVYGDAGILSPRAFVGFSCMGSSMMLKDRTVRLLTSAASRVAAAGGDRTSLELVELMSHPGHATTQLSVAQRSPPKGAVPMPASVSSSSASPASSTASARLTDREMAALAGCGAGPDRFAASIDRENEMTGLRGILRILKAHGVAFRPIA